MMNDYKEIRNFIDQSTTQNIIDIQFKRTRTFVKI